MRKALYDLQLYTSVSAKPESHSPSERIFPWIFFYHSGGDIGDFSKISEVSNYIETSYCN